MPEYVYGCADKDHPRVTVVHGMLDSPVVECKVCGEQLHRIPQPFLWGVDPLQLIRAWSERNWSKKLRHEPREEAYDSVTTDTGIPQRDFARR